MPKRPEVHEVFRGDRVHVLADKCSTCIFRSVNDGRILGLAPGRVAGMVQEARAMEGVIPCHSTIRQKDVKPAICKGYYDLPHRPWPLQLAEILGAITFDPPPSKEV